MLHLSYTLAPVEIPILLLLLLLLRTVFLDGPLVCFPAPGENDDGELPLELVKPLAEDHQAAVVDMSLIREDVDDREDPEGHAGRTEVLMVSRLCSVGSRCQVVIETQSGSQTTSPPSVS